MAPELVQTIHYGIDPMGFFARAHRREGDVFEVRVMGQRWTVLADPDAVKEVFAHGPEDLHSGEANETLRPLIGTRNVLLLDGEEHMRRRRLVLPPLHGERMRAYESTVTEAARTQLAGWESGRELSVLPHMQALTLAVILRAVFGVDEAERLRRLSQTLRDFLTWTTAFRRSTVFALAGPDRLMSMKGFKRQLAEVDAGVFAEIARRREDPDAAERTDVLSMLLCARYDGGTGLTDQELRDELVTLLVAGHETTAALATWALMEVAGQPDLVERLARREEGLAQAVVTETLRLHPPVPLVLRQLRTPLTIARREFPAGTTIAPCTAIIHRREDVYPDALAFRPDRFLGSRPAAGAFFPFGGGVRRCVGAAFAEFEARIVLTEVASAFTLQAGRRRPGGLGRRGIVIVPRWGGRLLPRRRSGLGRAAAQQAAEQVPAEQAATQ